MNHIFLINIQPQNNKAHSYRRKYQTKGNLELQMYITGRDAEARHSNHTIAGGFCVWVDKLHFLQNFNRSR
jgi:hypothetical protein